jgi:hypothetical protein
MSNIGSAGRDWFGKNSKNIAVSKYYEAIESYPGISVWWFSVPLAKLQTMRTGESFYLVSQKHVGIITEWYLLEVPKSYLLDQYVLGNLATLGEKLSLELSTGNCLYRGLQVKQFDDVCSTRKLNRSPVPFGQFQI